jgi:hypothetical protein
MSVLLFGAGAIAFLAGVAMVGFGVPVNEFSFGNTLIMSGTTAAVGGLIVIGLGAAVTYLQRIADALATQVPIRSGRPLDMLEPAAGARAPASSARIPFPPKPKSEVDIREPQPLESRTDVPAQAGMPLKAHLPEFLAPSLPNPDKPPVTVEDEVSLSPQHLMAASSPVTTVIDEPARQASPAVSLHVEGTETDDVRLEQPSFDAGWKSPPFAAPASARQSKTTYFDNMWPAEPKPAKSPSVDEAAPEAAFGQPQYDAVSAPAKSAEPDELVQSSKDEPRAVAILKSGVVDGMGYTLYVDGSIEAELPQGTLRFASINELRSHLEKTS